ncbi:MAG: hypothetical protein ACLTF5_02065 [Butyricicoccus sp.]
MDRKDDMDLESLKNSLSDVPDTDEFDLDSIIARCPVRRPQTAEPMPKASAEPEKPVSRSPHRRRDQGRGAKTAPRNKRIKRQRRPQRPQPPPNTSLLKKRAKRVARASRKWKSVSAGPRRRSAGGRHAARLKLAEKEAAEKAAEQQEIVEEAAAEAASRKASISRKQAKSGTLPPIDRGRGRYQAGRSRGGYARGTPPFGHSVVPVRCWC